MNFTNDKTKNRKRFAEQITKIIKGDTSKYTDVSDDSLVIAVDAPWGTGKTTFIDMWCNYLANDDGLYVINYNSWENDDWDDAFIPLLSHLVKEISDLDSDIGKQLKVNLMNLMQYIGKQALSKVFSKIDKVMAEKLIDIVNGIKEDDFNDWFDESISYEELKKLIKAFDIQKILESIKSEKIAGFLFQTKERLSILDEYQNYIKAKKSFLKCLNMIHENHKDKKIVFFIDELDRCRPKFAIETLEIIKHFMKLENVVFVISIDMEQLSHSVATHYGQNMDSQGYLRRFFHLHFKLKNSLQAVRNYISSICSDTPIDTAVFNKCAMALNLSIRDINHVKKNLVILHEVTLFNVYNDIILYFYYSMLMLKLKYPDIYKFILEENWTLSINSNSRTKLLDCSMLKNVEGMGRILSKLAEGNVLQNVGVIKKNIDRNNREDYAWLLSDDRSLFDKYTVGEYIDEQLDLISEY